MLWQIVIAFSILPFFRLVNERLGKDDLQLEESLDSLERQAADLSDKIRSRELMIDLLDDEYDQDLDVLYEWTKNVEDYEEDILALLRCQHEDSIRYASQLLHYQPEFWP